MMTLNARLPDNVHAKLKALAVADHRSLNNMMIVLIEREYERLIKMGA
jgi:predicted HicB family RNase H-like nuclease